MSLVVFDHAVQLVHFGFVHLHADSPDDVSCVRLHLAVREPFLSREGHTHRLGGRRSGQQTEPDVSYVSLTTTVTMSRYRGGPQPTSIIVKRMILCLVWFITKT